MKFIIWKGEIKVELIGIVIVIIGFALKFDTIAVVLVAGLSTGLVAHMSL